MRFQQVWVLCVLLVGCVAGLACAQAGTGFTYQGQLNDAGNPADGSFGMDFALWDAVSGGSQVGSTIALPGVAVTQGVFTVELDFGADAFNNTDRWLAIAVDGTALSPRQPISGSPYSLQTRGIKVNADEKVGMGVNPGSYRLRVWNLAGGGLDVVASGRSVQAITSTGDMAILASNQAPTGIGVYGQNQPKGNYGWLGSETHGVFGHATDPDTEWAGYFEGKGYFGDATFVGRKTEIASTEHFGVHAPVRGSNLGGMYISTIDDTGKPFYGYAAGGDDDMYHYYDGSTGKWHIYNNDADRFTVTGGGLVGIGTTTPSTMLQVIASGGQAAIWGLYTGSVPEGRGVWGVSSALLGMGVHGWATETSGTVYGVVGEADSPSGFDFFARGIGMNYGATSSIRWKSNIVNIDDPLGRISRLRGVYFDWDAEHGGRHDVGMIAEEVGAVLPEVVAYEENGIDAHGMDYSKLTPLLVEAVNALRAEKDAEHEVMAAENAQLRERLAVLEAAVEVLLREASNSERATTGR